MRLVKGHGTENDFLLLPDLDGGLDVTPELVRALCDRHAGVGADGVLRVVRSENDPEAKEMAAVAPFFMDYRNADGSVAEMCGNGIRVFVRYLHRRGLADARTAVATRAGVKWTQLEPGGGVTVQMGRPQVRSDSPHVTVPGLSAVGDTTHVEMPNPHVVVAVRSREVLGCLDLSRPPRVEPFRPEGQNVEFVVRLGERHLMMRVHERGVGETRSCGTGICAAVVAAAAAGGVPADGSSWRVDVPGGSCRVVWRQDGEIALSGPAVIVGEVDVDESWLASAGAG